MSNHVRRRSTLNHMPSGDENSIESVFTVYPREPASSENELRFSLAKTETRAIRYLKLVVIGVLMLAAIALSYVTFLLISQTEHDLFTSSFTNDANRLKVATYDVMLQRISVSAAFMIRYLMQAAIQGQDPVDTKIIDFNIFGHNMLRLGKAESIAYVPFIQRVNQSQWEKTTRTNTQWAYFSNDKNRSGFSSPSPLKTSIWNTTNNSHVVLYDSIVAPISQITPLEYRRDMLLLNCLSDKIRRQAIQVLLQDSRPVISGILDADTEVSFVKNYSYVPRSVVLVPIYRLNYTHNVFENETIGMVMIEHTWDAAFRGILQGTLCIRAVVSNICGDQFTLVIRGGNVKYIGNGDLHDPKYDAMMIKTSDEELLNHWEHYQDTILQSQYYYSQWSSSWILRPSLDEECRYTIRFYPTDDYHDVYVTAKPKHFAIGVVFIFLFTILCFLIYDYLVEKRQSVVMNTAVASSDIVNQLYPPSFVRRVIHQSPPTMTSTEHKCGTPILNSTNKTFKMIRRKSAHGPKELSSLKDILLRGSLPDAIQTSSSHIFAEMFTDVSIIFADISGFTAWSSEREPVQVFQLLEALYSAFDDVGKKLGVFKVETIGDCYVAVVGLPTPRPAHAVVMCRFAHEIHKCISSLTKELEVQLGPGTSDLRLRIGIHSGPVTAGILRGEKSRFQLFGDTMNTAARMESTGKRGKTQVSQDTAKLLTKFGKQHWLTSREELVYAKGKGELQTYWIHTTRRRHKSTQSNTVPHKEVPRLDDFIQPLEKNTSKTEEDWGQLSLDESCMDEVEGTQKERLIEWNTEMLSKMLCRLESKRRNASVNQFHVQRLDQMDESKQAHKMIPCQNELRHMEESTSSNSSILDSTAYSHFLKEIMGKQDLFVVTMPNYDGSTTFDDLSVDTCILSVKIRKELKQFVTDIAEYYNPLPFHNFEHASHVALSSLKLLNRVVAGASQLSQTSSTVESHFATFGIASDPLTHFVVVLAAIVHDAGHPGMTNAELIDTNHKLSQMYSQKSIAECHSIYLTLTTLDKYKLLQRSIYKTEEECNRFRDLLCHSVLATDIIGNKLDSLWTLAFDSTAESEHDVSSLLNRRASVALQLIIQASDVAHTMQHWHVYTKWNEKLFVERYLAYKSGSSSVDPSLRWYEGELSFLDNYVIPLAKRLRECKIYGVSSEEYYGFAIENRREWERKGRDIVSAFQLRASIGYSNNVTRECYVSSSHND